MPEMMAAYLMHFYNGMSAEDAAEIVLELPDKRSLRSLADYRVAGAVPVSTLPNDLEGLL